MTHSLKPCINTGQIAAGECADCVAKRMREQATEAVGKSRGEWIALVYELWQEDLIDEEVYRKAIQRDINRKGPR